jgi:hypothetical protein
MTAVKRLDPDSPPAGRDDAVWEDSKWHQKPVKGPLAVQIRRVAARRTKALEAAERAQAELMPLLDRARQEGPERLSNRQLEALTGITYGYIHTMVANWKKKQARNGEAE